MYSSCGLFHDVIRVCRVVSGRKKIPASPQMNSKLDRFIDAFLENSSMHCGISPEFIYRATVLPIGLWDPWTNKFVGTIKIEKVTKIFCSFCSDPPPPHFFFLLFPYSLPRLRSIEFRIEILNQIKSDPGGVRKPSCCAGVRGHLRY